MTAKRVRIGDRGRLIVPVAYRKALGLETGDTVLIDMRGDELVVRPAKAVLRRLQERLSPYAGGASVVDEFIAERRAEARRDRP